MAKASTNPVFAKYGLLLLVEVGLGAVDISLRFICSLRLSLHVQLELCFKRNSNFMAAQSQTGCPLAKQVHIQISTLS